VLNYRFDGVERRYTIGSFRDPWKAAEARREAKRLKKLIDQGVDPQGDRNEERAAPTVDDLIEHWRTVHAPKNRASSTDENESLIRQWIKPKFANRRVADIRLVDVEVLHRKITARGTRFRANRVLALLSKMFSLAVRAEWRADNPCRGVERNYEEPRERYLKPEELGRLIEALAAYPNRQAADAVRLLLLTGARRGEVLSARWDQFNLDAVDAKGNPARVWIKPSSHTKQKRLHRVPLSAPAVELLREIGERQQRETADYNTERRLGQAKREPSAFVFPTKTGSAPIADIRHDWARLRKAAGLDGLRLHDLRHSYASILASAGLSLPVIGALLGHSNPTTTSRYSHLFDDPMRAAAEKVGRIVDAAARKVVPLSKGDVNN
jgi:integrase